MALIRVHPFSVGLARPFTSSRGQFDRRNGVLVSIQVGELLGWGEASPLPGLSTESLSDAEQELMVLHETAPTLPSSIEAISPWVHSHCKTASGQHALATALLDSMGQWANKPVSQLLNRHTIKEIPISHLYTDDDSLFHATVLGTQLVKMKVGIGSIDDDFARVVRVREVLGADIPIRVDANGAWSEQEAMEAIDRLGPLGVRSIEEPVKNRDLAAMARLRGRGMDIAADESIRSHEDLTNIIEQDAADAIVIKPMLIGTPMAAIDMVEQANRAGLKTWVTTTIDGAVGRMMAIHIAAAAPTKHLLPCGLNTAGWLKTDVGQTPEMSGSHINAPDAPGLGVTVVV
jgi:o-succinylbenzoate synthase